MFNALDEKEFNIVVDAMAEHHFKEGDPVIKQGEDGEELYVLESGTLKCEKIFAPATDATFLKNY